jgi:hypothetical protein
MKMSLGINGEAETRVAAGAETLLRIDIHSTPYCQRPFKSPHFRPNFFPTSFVVR